jgi:superfamily II DNA/RNA helicase
MKNQKKILEKLKIEKLNPMQEKAAEAISSSSELIILSPTGTGKTLAFLLPIIANLEKDNNEVQCLILVPTRELAIQIEQVAREMGSGYKVNAIYGGRSGTQDKLDLKHPPAILIGTPGRMADRFRRKTFSFDWIKTIVLDEFDKSLEIGFESEMIEIFSSLKKLKKKILTSATKKKIPDFVAMKKPRLVNFLEDNESKLKIRQVNFNKDTKAETLFDLICHLRTSSGIVFCNFKESISLLSKFLDSKKIAHGYFHGGMEQIDREKTLIKFRNGTLRLILATDLAARGIDVTDINFIIHYELPKKEKEFIHRNGRTARMEKDGTAYILKDNRFDLPEFIGDLKVEHIEKALLPHPTIWHTLYINGGRRDKISKGDLLGFLIKQGGLTQEDIGVIELKQDASYVSVHSSRSKGVIKNLDNIKLKKKKVRISII